MLLWLLLLMCWYPGTLARLENTTRMSFMSSSGIQFPNFNSDSSPCTLKQSKQTLKLHLTRRPNTRSRSLVDSTSGDFTRIQTLHRRILHKNDPNQTATSHRIPSPTKDSPLSGHVTATLASGVTLGSGEYLMDVFVGTPPKHFSLILDTGSDLNWLQCHPCKDCFEQNGPHYNPSDSSSFSAVSCRDERCGLVTSPDHARACSGDNQTCPYYYWYGDSSNTTGDFALETFTVNLTDAASGSSGLREVKEVMFGCGHWNRGLFHGAAGLLGLGRGPLSFASQIRSLYGHSFSYCLVDRNSDVDVRSKLIFGDDESHEGLNFTNLLSGSGDSVETFYYVGIGSVSVGGEVLPVPEETWNFTESGGGGAIVDSGTTLSYFAEPGYTIIRDAFLRKVKEYGLVGDFPVLSPCYNVSGVENVEMPEFGILFRDGAVWNFPIENYFIRIEPEGVMCLAILGTPKSSISIIGNYQQQNFHILYDTKMSRLGFARTNCADL